jgi:uncharacterized protein
MVPSSPRRRHAIRTGRQDSVNEHPAPGPPPPSPPPPLPPVPPAPPPEASGAGPEGDRARPGLDGRERELAPAAVTSWRISAALSAIVPVVVAIVLGFVFAGGWAWLILAGALGLLLLSVVVLPRMRYRRWRWQLTDLAVELHYGILVRKQETVPYFRIQQIDINAGPVDRLLELATLRVQTASASGTALLPGLAAAEAPVVRAELLARAAEAVGEHPGDLRDAV